jgi:hypothetical protein
MKLVYPESNQADKWVYLKIHRQQEGYFYIIGTKFST